MSLENVIDNQIVYQIPISHDVDHLAVLGDILESLLHLFWNIEFGIEATSQEVQNWPEMSQHRTLELSRRATHCIDPSSLLISGEMIKKPRFIARMSPPTKIDADTE